MKVSVIIPMYNAEKYFGVCLESLLIQTFTDFEVIVVDDCSTDNSLAIAESYLEKFGGRLRIYTNEKNSEAAVSRNNGLLLSRSKYIFYMDSDDLLLLTGLEKMYKIAEKYDSEVVNMTGYYKMSSDGKELTTIQNRKKRIFENDEDEIFVDEDLNWRLQKPLTYRFYGSACFRLFRRDFLIKNRIFFPENIKRLEDVVWKYSFLIMAKKIVHTSASLYFYRMTPGSKTRTKRSLSQYVNYRLTPIFYGLKWIDEIMNRVKFFEQNPKYRYKLLEELTEDLFTRMIGYTQKRNWSATDIFNATKQEFAKKLNKYDVLVAELSSLIEKQQREIADLEEQLKAPEKEKIL